MKALRSETRTNGPEGLTTSEGDLEHPFKDREPPPTPNRVLRQVQTGRGKGEEVEPGWTCPGQEKEQETESRRDRRMVMRQEDPIPQKKKVKLRQK